MSWINDVLDGAARIAAAEQLAQVIPGDLGVIKASIANNDLAGASAGISKLERDAGAVLAILGIRL